MRILGSCCLAVALLAAATHAHAAGEAEPPIARSWQHDGFFGTIDRAAAQRGYQVYREICSGCHGLEYVPFRALAGIGYSEDEIKAIAAEYSIVDGPDEDGEMFDRPGLPSDTAPPPFANEEQGRASNNGAYPPDLSLIAKARVDGDNYVYSLMQGYGDPPGDVVVPEGMNYNRYFAGHMIAMAQPLYGDDVTYADGTPATIEQQAADLAVFLTWAAEPTLEERKAMGLKSMIFLVVMAALLYAMKRRIWADVH